MGYAAKLGGASNSIPDVTLSCSNTAMVSSTEYVAKQVTEYTNFNYINRYASAWSKVKITAGWSANRGGSATLYYTNGSSIGLSNGVQTSELITQNIDHVQSRAVYLAINNATTSITCSFYN